MFLKLSIDKRFRILRVKSQILPIKCVYEFFARYKTSWKGVSMNSIRLDCKRLVRALVSPSRNRWTQKLDTQMGWSDGGSFRFCVHKNARGNNGCSTNLQEENRPRDRRTNERQRRVMCNAFCSTVVDDNG